MKVGGYKVVVKPALVVLAAAIAIGVAAVSFSHRAPAEAAPEQGYVAPDRWKFESRDGAEVSFQPSVKGSVAQPANPDTPVGQEQKGVRLLDSESGFTIHVTQVGKTPDCVYLRNSLNLDDVKKQGALNDLQLSFDAQAQESFPVTFVIRDPLENAQGSGALWSQTFTVQGPLKNYSVTVPKSALERSAHSSCIIAAHLGAQVGTVEIAKIRLR